MTEKDLVERFPNMFVGLGGTADELPEGWLGIVERLCECLVKSQLDSAFTVVQIKEKFGGLRFYVHYHDHVAKEQIAEIDKIITFVERLSHYVCQQCGHTHGVATDTYENLHWVVTLCEDCQLEAVNRDE